MQRLQPDQNGDTSEARGDLDSELGVVEWRSSRGQPTRPRPAEVEPDAPSWWHSDEDSSQSFLQAMGVKLD